MTLFLASVFLGIVPMTIYAFVIWRLDRWEREPFPLVLAAFLWGAVPSIIFAIVAQVILGLPLQASGGEPSLGSQLYQASLVAPITEEIFKGIGVALIFLIFRREIDSLLDGLIYGSMIGFGFSAVENILYFSGQPDAASLIGLFFLRAFIFGMLHALFTGLTGIGFALGLFSKIPFMKLGWPVLGLMAAMATHSLHNYFATLGGEHILYAVLGITVGIAWFAVTAIVCLVHENRWIRIQLADEVSNGVLYSQQALDAASFWSRSSLNGFAQGFGTILKRKKLLHEATELAYVKQRHEKFGADGKSQLRLEQLRAIVRELSRKDPLLTSGVIQPDQVLPPPLPPVRRIPPPLPGKRG